MPPRERGREKECERGSSSSGRAKKNNRCLSPRVYFTLLLGETCFRFSDTSSIKLIIVWIILTFNMGRSSVFRIPHASVVNSWVL